MKKEIWGIAGFLLAALCFLLLTAVWWQTPVYDGKTPQGMYVKYIPYNFSHQPLIKWVVVYNPTTKVETWLYCNGCDVPYADSLNVNAMVDRCFKGKADLPPKFSFDEIRDPPVLSWPGLPAEVTAGL